MQLSKKTNKKLINISIIYFILFILGRIFPNYDLVNIIGAWIFGESYSLIFWLLAYIVGLAKTLEESKKDSALDEKILDLNNDNSAEKLKKWLELRDLGAITEEEYLDKKNQILRISKDLKNDDLNTNKKNKVTLRKKVIIYSTSLLIIFFSSFAFTIYLDKSSKQKYYNDQAERHKQKQEEILRQKKFQENIKKNSKNYPNNSKNKKNYKQENSSKYNKNTKGDYIKYAKCYGEMTKAHKARGFHQSNRSVSIKVKETLCKSYSKGQINSYEGIR